MNLNNSLDRSFIENIYKSFRLLENKKVLIYDPGLDKEVVLLRSSILTNCWRLYFKILMPYLKPIYKKETTKIINTIFANELYKIRENVFKNATYARISFNTLKEKVYDYKNI